MDAEIRCSFCRRGRTEVVKLIAGASGVICDRCVEACAAAARRGRPRAGAFPVPADIAALLDRSVIGQREAKRRLAVAVRNHAKRIAIRAERAALAAAGRSVADDVEVAKSNVLMVGPSGTGKTALARALAKAVDAPFAVADATTLTGAGSRGADPKDALKPLLRAAGGDPAKAARGILYLDEADKLAFRGGGADAPRSVGRSASGDGTPKGDVQRSLLRLVEGDVVELVDHDAAGRPTGRKVAVDTTDILWIFGGAFEGLAKLVGRRIAADASAGVAGFHGSLAAGEASLAAAEPRDFTAYGIMPELVGRLPVIAVLDRLGVDELAPALVEPDDAPLRQYRALVLAEGARLTVTDAAVRAIAARAAARGGGARRLKSEMEALLLDAMFALPGSGGGEVVLDLAAVEAGAAVLRSPTAAAGAAE